MARAKATYGRKPKATPAFAATTGFWSSPNKDSPDAKSAPANAIDDLTTAIENLDVKEREKTERKERKKKEKRDRALQAIDGNAASPVRKLETLKKPCTPNADNKKPAASAHAENPSIAPKTPQRVKQLLPKKKAATPTEDQTPQSERRRRRRGKRDIPTIVLDDDGDDDAISASEAASTQPPTTRPRATSTPERPLALPKTTATKSKPSTSSRRRRRSPSVLTTPKPAPDPLTAYTKPLLRLCADRAGRKCPTPFALWSASLEPYFAVHKIAEASYGEVYRLALRAPQPGLGASDESVLKIIALKPPPESRPTGRGKKAEARRETIEGMSSVESVAGEIRLLQRMALVPGFTNFRDVRVLRGAPSGCFVDAWRAWNEGREEEKRSIFPDPGRKGSYDDEQLWAVIEMQDAGTDLENVRMEEVGGVFGVWDVFWSVALALGKGEEEARFEHRDLHMGNICIRPANAIRPIAAPSSITDVARNLGFTGLESTIIDYTLSRAQMTHPLASPDPEEAEIAYLDLEEDPAVFEGDAEEEYQYEIYRYMRAAMYLGDPLADLEARWDEADEAGRTWVGFHPQTNLVWLHFILHEMMAQIAPARKKNGRGGRGGNKKEAASKKSRKKVVEDSEDDDEDEQKALERLVEDKRRKLEKILKKVQALLDPQSWSENGLFSVKDLVALALEEAWLDEEDVIAVPLMEEEGSLLELVRAMDVEDGRGR
ncbi:hypothetical protein SLS57_003200 [Botryosphaeria dothidea]